MMVTMASRSAPASAFSFDADHLALDFLNTYEGSGGRPVERLASPAAVLAWHAAAGLDPRDGVPRGMASPPVARTLLLEAVRLRSALARAIGAWTGGTLAPDDALLGLNRVLDARDEGCRVVRAGSRYRVETVVTLRGALGLLAPVALAGATLLAEGDPKRVRRCDAPGCGLWFLDTSKNGSRRWCSMARCGNRVKAAAHKRRKREAAS